MNFSNEEIYSMYGQYDRLVNVEFHIASEGYKKFGASIMGTFKYTEEERNSIIAILKQDEIPRTEKHNLFIPQDSGVLTSEQKESYDREGILCSDISAISAYDYHEPNRFTESAKKEIPNTIQVKTDFDGWYENQLAYNFLKSRYLKKEDLSPYEEFRYFGLRTYYKENITDDDYLAFATKSDGKSIKDKVRYFELEAKFNDNLISDDDINEFITLIAEETNEKNRIIDLELERTNQKLLELIEHYGDKIENLKKICSSFEEEILLYGEKIIYLDFERFVHIFSRHVTETKIGDKSKIKTVFQYKFDSIMQLISAVLESSKDEIQEHFKNNPEEQFRRMGSRSIYVDGHYYRVEIKKDGRLFTFHPYNNNEEKIKDDK